MRIASVGHAVFAATMIALGILALIQGGFPTIYDSAPKGLPAREALAYLCAFILLGSGIGLLSQRAATTAARVLLVSLLLWMLLVKGYYIVLAPTAEGPYQSWGETAVMVAGTWVLYAWIAADWDKQRLRLVVGERGVHIARVFYGLALIAFGLSHFAYLNLTAPLVPGWLPAPVFWAYFTGCTYLAAGAAVLIGVCARLAAVLSALQMGLFLPLVWIPIVAAGGNAFQWSETVYTWALVAGAWVVAESYRGMPWFAVNKR